MIMMCHGCHKRHNDFSWKSYWEGTSLITICSQFFKPSPPKEYIPERVKEERQEYAKSLLQPWRSGEPSKEFIEAYPQRAEKLFSVKERKNAKNVWSDVPGVKHWEKTK